MKLENITWRWKTIESMNLNGLQQIPNVPPHLDTAHHKASLESNKIKELRNIFLKYKALKL